MTYREDGVVRCCGANAWRAEVLGWVEIHPGVDAIHVRSTQTTTWTEGHVDGGCSAGWVTNWQEDYYLLDDLPTSDGGSAPAMKRSIGGNLDVNAGRWDVWFDRWERMPS